MTEIDEYLTRLSASEKVELERIRAIVKRLIPEAEEVISYGMPTLKYKGKNLLHFAAFKDHLSLFPTAGPTEALKERLRDFKTSKGTIQFTVEHPLPQEIVEEIVRLRMAGIDARS